MTGAPDAALIDALAALSARGDPPALAETTRGVQRRGLHLVRRYGLPIQARNQLDTETKKSENLWYEESLPPDTLMYALVVERTGGALSALSLLFPPGQAYLQAGGNETVGQGWFAVTVRQAESDRVRPGMGGGGAA